jgi:hypothetical protein
VIAVSSSPRQTSEAERGTTLRWVATVLLAAAVCALPSWLWYVPLRFFLLKLDDFDYLMRSRTSAAFWRHLFTPHNVHVVPLFRLETHLLARLAGSIEALPDVLGCASYATLVLAVLLTGHLVARETGRPGPGLVAMAAVGFSSVLGTSLLWYAASQALAAGVMILVMLTALQAWRVQGSWWLLASGLLAAMAAPLFWTAGYTAGLVGTAYLLADGRRSCQRAAVLPVAVSVVTFLLVWRITDHIENQKSPFSGTVVSFGTGVVHSAQAVCETLLLKNFGLDATTTPAQALALASLLALLWIWSHSRFGPRGSGTWPPINPLEVAGVVLVVGSYGMIHSVRGTQTSFEEVRTLGWYDSIAELGAILFVFGWWAGRLDSPPARTLRPPERGELLVVVLVGAIILLIQEPRIERVIYRYDGLGASVRPELIMAMPLRTPVDLAERARAQRQALALLDRLEQAARERRVDREAIHQSLTRTPVRGMPEFFADPAALGLLDIPDDSKGAGR